MRRLGVRFRPEALADLEDVYRHVYRFSVSPTVANGLINRLRARCSRIGAAPHGGRPRDDLMTSLRTVPFEECVRITNIFYGGRDYDALYRKRAAPDEDG